MNRKVTEKIEGLERKLGIAVRGGEQEHEQVLKLWALLNNLLVLDPSLEKYHQIEGPWDTLDWDYEGVAKAIKFRAQETLADKYAPKADV